MNPLIIIRGGGGLASGVALRLHRVGFQVAILELEKPLAVRRTVSFSEAVYEGIQTVEGVIARIVSADQFQVTLEAREIPLLIDASANILRNQFLTSPHSTIVVDARLTKQEPELLQAEVPLHIGLGPGFSAGENCHAVIETRRSHTLGRVYWQGRTQADSGLPEGNPQRVLRAPIAGTISTQLKIGDLVEKGTVIAQIHSAAADQVVEITSPFAGVLRGMIRPGIEVTEGMKIGDVDERNDPSVCNLVSDKALSVGGGVLEAILTKYPMADFGENL
jgi:xanthine dehydrogenase accessory factor